MQKKLVVLFILVLLAFAGLSARLIMINKDNGEQYKKQVLSQRQYSSKTIPYKRGEILDSKGTKLATNEKVYDLVLDIKQMNDKKEYVEPTIQALGGLFRRGYPEGARLCQGAPGFPVLCAQKAHEL